MCSSTDVEIIRYENFIKNELVFLPKEKTWKKNKRNWGDPVHRLCSYVAMFSPSLANFFIGNYSSENDVVIDTFSGRGTTILEARLLGRKAYGMDLNPFAYVLSKSKSESFEICDVIERVNQWENKYNASNKNFLKDLNPVLGVYYSEYNLKQLYFIREYLGLNYKTLSPIDNFILALALGLMHGPTRKSGETIYFSLSMSNHTSMSPKYVENYSTRNNLQKPEDNIFDKIRNRAHHVLKNARFCENKAEIKIGNALDVNKHFTEKAKLIFTSPPYLNLINYTKQNWLKMWLLGFDNEEQSKRIGLDDKHNFNNYESFIEKYMIEISKLSDYGTNIILVIGDANKKRTESNYFELIWEKIKNKIPLNLIETYTDKIDQNKKATSSLGIKSGQATKVDKIYVFRLKN